MHVNTAKAAALLGCSVSTARKLARTGSIPALKGPDGWLFDVAHIALRLAQGTTTGATAFLESLPRDPSGFVDALRLPDKLIGHMPKGLKFAPKPVPRISGFLNPPVHGDLTDYGDEW